jgi:hypothetical protein
VSNSHRRPARIGVALAVSATLVACATEKSDRLSGASTTPTVVAQNRLHFQYAIFLDNRWQLKEAIDPLATDPLFQQERPPLAWYAEYERFVQDPTDPKITQGLSLRLSGHNATLVVSRESLETLGIVFETVTVPGRKAIGSTTSRDPSSPTILLMEAAFGSVQLLSHELDVADLVKAAEQIKIVDADIWRETGGVVLRVPASEAARCKAEHIPLDSCR